MHRDHPTYMRFQSTQTAVLWARLANAVRPAILLALLVLTGCAADLSTKAPESVPDGETGAISGHLHGGQQPVAYATVQIWAVGTSGYGSTGTLYATTTTLNDGYGSFYFTKAANTDTPYPNTGSTWACPASSNPYMYITAKGGNTQGTGSSSTLNTAAAFLLGVGQCSTISSSSYYVLNEITTVGSLAALTQYFSPVTDTVGAPNTTLAQQGLANAFGVIPSLVNIYTGGTVGRTSHTYNYALPETPKIDTIADVLAACVNTATVPSANCTTLFNNAYPPAPAVTSQPSATFATATDTLQALWYMFANVSDSNNARVNALYALVGSSSPFQPTLSYAPTDWNVGITYYSVPKDPACNGTLSNNPSQVVISPTGPADFLMTSSSGGFLELSPGGALSAGTCSYPEQRQLEFDTRGYRWITYDTNTYITAYTSASTSNSVGWATPVTPYLVAADGNGNIFWSAKSTGAIYEIPSATIVSAGTSGSQPSSTSTMINYLPNTALAMVADTSGNLWVACSDMNIYELVKSSGYGYALATAVPGYPGSVNSMAINASGELIFPYYVSSSSSNYIGHLSGSPGAYTVYYTTGSFGDNAVATDGAGNLWTANEASYSINGVNTGYILETSKSGTALVPPYGLTKPANSSEFSSTLVQNEVVMGTSSSIAIDLSGNLYVVNSFSNMFNTTDGEQSTVTEMVGVAVPVVASIATGLANGTIGTKP